MIEFNRNIFTKERGLTYYTFKLIAGAVILALLSINFGDTKK